MLGDWGFSLVNEVLPIALGVVASPIAIAVVIALLMTRGASFTATGFVVGWCIGLFVMVMAFAWLSDAVGFEGAGARPVLAVIELSAAGLLVLIAVVQLFGGRGLASRSLRGLDGFRMPQAAAVGLGGSVLGPKSILLTGVAGATAATSTAAGHVWPAAAAFALVGSIGVATPVLVYLAARERVGGALVRVREWIAAHDRMTSVVSLLVVAAVLAVDGLTGHAG